MQVPPLLTSRRSPRRRPGSRDLPPSGRRLRATPGSSRPAPGAGNSPRAECGLRCRAIRNIGRSHALVKEDVECKKATSAVAVFSPRISQDSVAVGDAGPPSYDVGIAGYVSFDKYLIKADPTFPTTGLLLSSAVLVYPVTSFSNPTEIFDPCAPPAAEWRYRFEATLQ